MKKLLFILIGVTSFTNFAQARTIRKYFRNGNFYVFNYELESIKFVDQKNGEEPRQILNGDISQIESGRKSNMFSKEIVEASSILKDDYEFILLKNNESHRFYPVVVDGFVNILTQYGEVQTLNYMHLESVVFSYLQGQQFPTPEIEYDFFEFEGIEFMHLEIRVKDEYHQPTYDNYLIREDGTHFFFSNSDESLLGKIRPSKNGEFDSNIDKLGYNLRLFNDYSINYITEKNSLHWDVLLKTVHSNCEQYLL
ncbi:MAG: hypothetical protein H6622_16305 [Halobacteriovoraceae bacterium]|nr:hypothetical protein [Halobacteriovoraceae bacterium]